MNIFRLLGDFSHLAAIIILLWKIWKTRSCAGKTTEMFHTINLQDIVFQVYRAKVFYSMPLSSPVVIWIYLLISLVYTIRL